MSEVRKVFCGGLPWEADENDLRQGMEEFGPIEEVKVVRDRETGKSRGFGFVTFVDSADAQKALATENIQVGHRTVHIHEANEQGRRGAGGGGGGRGPGRDRHAG